MGNETAVARTHEKLARMANQIADYFKSYPDDEAIAGVHEHIRSFWSPVMRRDLAAGVADDPSRFHPLVLAALKAGDGGPTPARKETAGPDQVGEIAASDAG